MREMILLILSTKKFSRIKTANLKEKKKNRKKSREKKSEVDLKEYINNIY